MTILTSARPSGPELTVAQQIAAYRYEMETKGIYFNGLFLDTGRDSQALITGAALSAFMDPTYICNWKTTQGFVQIDAPTLLAVSKEIRKYVQACFDREGVLLQESKQPDFDPSSIYVGWP